MTKEEEKIVKAFLSRTRIIVNQLSELADGFHNVGMKGTSECLRGIRQSIEYDTFDYFAKKLIKDWDHD